MPNFGRKNWFFLAVFALLFGSYSIAGSAESTDNEKSEEKFEPTEVIMHHIMDGHDWHILDWEGHPVSLPLPVILWTDNGLVTFMSSEFHHDDHGHHPVTVDGQTFVKSHGHIYYAAEGHGGHAEDHAHGHDAHHEGEHADDSHAESHESHGDSPYLTYETLESGERVVANAAPLDFSITKNVASLLLITLLCLVMFIGMARRYKTGLGVPKKGVAKFVEPLVVFIRDEVALQNIGEKHYKRFTPYLLTLFFFIWLNNMLGLVPFIPGGANTTGNIAVTLVLAVFTLLLMIVNGNKHYWGHMLWMPGVPVPVRILLAPIELVGMVAKPFALMIRLFANMTAGHIVILSLISLVFIFETVWISPAAVGLTLFIFIIKVLVALLQAYIFALLTALFIGQAVEEPHH